MVDRYSNELFIVFMTFVFAFFFLAGMFIGYQKGITKAVSSMGTLVDRVQIDKVTIGLNETKLDQALVMVKDLLLNISNSKSK